MKHNKRIKYFVREYHDRLSSKLEVLELLDAEIADDYTSQSALLKKKILTPYQVVKYQKNGILNPKRHRGKKYFLKSEVKAVLEAIVKKKEGPQGTLF